MLYIKKYFTEGLIQMAILLSLCGVRVDVGLEPFLPSSWQEMILGPTSALTQTQFHNLRNRLEDGHGLHPKNMDLDGFFTARRLLGWVRSLDRLQIPHTELETWLVQREADPIPMDCQDQASRLERAPAGMERDPSDLTLEPTVGLGALQEEEEAEDKEEGAQYNLHHSEHLDERVEEEEDEEGNMARMQRHHGRMGGGSCVSNRVLTSNEAELGRSATKSAPFPHNTSGQRSETSFSIQECLRLLEETFPLTEQQQISDAGVRRGDQECQPPSRETLLSPIIPSDNPSLDLELQWQDVFDIMEPENTDMDMMTSFDHALDWSHSGTVGVQSETLNFNNLESGVIDADEVHVMETPPQHGFMWSFRQPEPEPDPSPAIVPLTPSAELDDHSSTFITRDALKSSNVNPFHSPPNHMDLFGQAPLEDFCIGHNADGNESIVNMNLLAQGLVDNMENGALYSEDLSNVAYLPDLTPSGPAPSQEGKDMTQNILMSPSSVFLADEEDGGDEDSLPEQLSDIFEEAAILHEVSLLDLSLEEGFGPEMEARLEEEGYLNCQMAKQDSVSDDHSTSTTVVTGIQSEQRRRQQDDDVKADSDSGLSLDCSFSPASPCVSEASYYSTSSSSSSASSSSWTSHGGSPFSGDMVEDIEERLVGSDMEVEISIKQEELEEEEMGAVGGEYPNSVKFFPVNYGDHKMLNGFPLHDNIDHDHTYTQSQSSASPSPSLHSIASKHTKSVRQHHNPRRHHYSSSRRISNSKMWSRDERRAQAWKIPFSNELIVHLPVEEFNDLLTNYQLSEEQLTLIRDIRRRGKNKVAAQNCRKRKMSVLLGLENDVTGLRRQRLRLLRDKQDALRNLQEMKRRLSVLYQDVFSRLRDEEGRPLDPAEYSLDLGPSGHVMVTSHQQEAWAPVTRDKTSKKQRNKKK